MTEPFLAQERRHAIPIAETAVACLWQGQQLISEGGLGLEESAGKRLATNRARSPHGAWLSGDLRPAP